MTITLTPDSEQMLTEEAEKMGTTTEALALKKLRLPAPIDYRITLPRAMIGSVNCEALPWIAACR